MPTRLLLLITDLEIGGTPTVVRELAKRLHEPRAGVHVEVACLSKWGPVADELRQLGIDVTALGAASTAAVLGTTAALVRLISTHRIDTVLSFLVHANAVAAAASKLCRRTRFFQSIQTTQPTPKWHWKIQMLAQHAARRVIVPSDSTAVAAHDGAGVPREKIVIIPNALDADGFEQSKASLNPPTPFPVGFIGRLDAVKRVPELVRQLKLLHQTFPRTPVHLHIFGEGDQRWHVEQEIDRLRLRGAVTLHGRVDRPHEALSQIGILVLPSIAEGFGLVLIEAMAAGVPLVATNVPGIRDVVRHEETGLLVDPHRPMDIAFAIMRLIEDSQLRRMLIQNGLRGVRERFSWDHALAAYRATLGIYRASA